MRTFLVGMCDIFLILYLTAMGQIDERQVSALTVDDYTKVVAERDAGVEARERTEAEVKSLTEQYERVLAEVGLLQKQKINSEAELQSLNENLKKIKEEAAADIEQSKSEFLAELESARDRERAQQESLKQALAEVREKAKELQETEQRLAREAEERQKLEQSERQVKEEFAAAQVSMSDLQARLSAAQQRQEELAKQKEEADLARQEAETEALSAALKAQKEQVARETAEREAAAATSKAFSSRIAETLAKADLRTERSTRKKSQSALKAVTRSPKEVFQQSVMSQMKQVQVTVTTENALFGDSSKVLKLRGVPARIGGKTLLVFPAEQMGLDSDVPARRFKNLAISVQGQGASSLCRVGSVRYGLVGIPTTAGRQGEVDVDSPVWLAVRNGSRLPFADRWREQASDFVAVRRDRLKNQAGLLKFKRSGSRGYGDYADRIVSGDILVDLSGQVRGVGVGVNEVLPLQSLKPVECRPLDADAAGVASFLRKK